MTPYSTVYDAFLVRVLDDEWGTWTEDEVSQDLHGLLEAALPFFKFPRVSLERDEFGFTADLSAEEIQIIATYMKCEWLNRTMLTWENIKPMYEERDFSQANFLEKLRLTLEEERKNARRLEGVYYRSVNRKPFDYKGLARN